MSSISLFPNIPALTVSPASSPSTTTTTAAAHHLPPPDTLALLIDKSKSIHHVLQIHAALLRHDLLPRDHRTLNFKLQRSYSNLNYLHYSLALFHQTNNPNIFFYSSIINSHSSHGLHDQAISLYIQMLNLDLLPNEFTLSSVLKSSSLENGKAIHSQAIQLGYFGSDLYVMTGLLDLYARFGDVESAKKVFDKMPVEKSLVSLTSMMTCYAKHGEIKKARELFDKIEEKDVVCWNVMIDGYTQYGMANEAMVLFRQMLVSKVKPNERTLSAMLSTCGQIGALESGRWLHRYAVDNHGIQFNVHVGAALIDMYSKCGSLKESRLVFNRMVEKDVVVWNSMIAGYAMHGNSQEALSLFDKMCRVRLRPTDITFIGILTACGHAGLVKKGWTFFNSMKDVYRIEPKIEHYGCMVNLLSRAGCLDDAYQLARNMKVKADTILWVSILGACKEHGNIALGEEIAEFVLNNNLANSGTYVLLSNMYATIGNWDGVAKVRTLMKESGVLKEPGCSSIEVNNKVHEFLAGDLRHPESEEIYKMLEEINIGFKAHG